MFEPLTSWFSSRARDLPWRSERSPYRVWISEVMLQQTHVETVIPYFHRWMERFPTVRDLATAHLDDVLKAWEGLGYYRRAVNLHRAAAIVMDTYGGRVPTDPEELLDLPGVGHYTAAAVAAFAAGRPLLPVDANVQRVAARLFTLSGAAGPQTVKKYLQRNLGSQNPGSTAEALMELGALVCTSRSPRCGACPLSPSCKAYQLGRATDFPERRRRKERPQRFRFAAVIIRKGKIYLERRPEGGLLGGTWGFPQISTPPNRCSLLNPVRHGYTHFDLTLTPAVVEGSQRPDGSGAFLKPHEIAARALSQVDHKVLARLRETYPSGI